MPVVREDSSSPPLRQFSHSPERSRPGDAPGPSKKPKLTTADLQKRQLEKLFQNPEKEVQLPTGARERTLRAPVEMMKNVQGSSSGAGSGEFHVYKQSRRREFERLKIMSDKTRALEEQAAFAARQATRDAEAEAKTAKNRTKRAKRKAGRKGGDAADGKITNGGPGGGSGDLKRKLGGSGAGVVFKRPGEESDDDETQGEEEVRQTMVESVPALTALPEVPMPKVVEETRIMIHDDERIKYNGLLTSHNGPEGSPETIL